MTKTTYFALVSLLLGLAMTVPVTAAGAPTVLITGSNRGIGFEFARQYAAKGWNVIATCRNPDSADALKELAAENPRVLVEKLDVLDLKAIDALADKYEGQPIDVLLSNAGVLGGFENQIFGDLRYELFDVVMRTNARGPLKLAEAFVENVAMSEQKKIMTVTSTAGSFTNREIKLGGRAFYRASKTAVNMMMRTLAKELAERQIIVGLISPPLTRNDDIRKAEIEGGFTLPAVEPDVSVRALIEVIDSYTLEKSGLHITHKGEIEPW